MMPTESELMAYCKRVKLVNFTKIAKHFKVSPHSVPDILKPCLETGMLRIRKIGSSKFVEVVGKFGSKKY